VGPPYIISSFSSKTSFEYKLVKKKNINGKIQAVDSMAACPMIFYGPKRPMAQ